MMPTPPSQPETPKNLRNDPLAGQKISAPGLVFAGQEWTEAVKLMARLLVRAIGHNPDQIVTQSTFTISTPHGTRHAVKPESQQELWKFYIAAGRFLLAEITDVGLTSVPGKE